MTYRAQYADLIGPCPNCQSNVNIMSEAEAKVTVEQFNNIANLNPELAAHIKDLPYLCAACFNAAMEARGVEIATMQNNVRRHRTYASGLLPQIARKATIATSDPAVEARCPEVWARIRSETFAPNIWVYGPPGTGKTFTAHAYANAAINAGHTVAELAAAKFREITAEWDRKAAKKYIAAYLLIIEDIDKVMWTPPEVELLFNILDGRVGKGMLVITSNMEPEPVGKAIKQGSRDNATMAAAIFDRMLPMERTKISGDSLRKG